MFASCSNFQEVEIKQVKNIELKGFKNNAAQVAMDLEIYNPNKLSFTIQEIDLKVYANKQYLGKLNTDSNIKIKRKVEDTYPVDVQIRLANILTGASMFMALKQSQSVTLQLEGTIKAKSLLMKKEILVKEVQEVRF